MIEQQLRLNKDLLDEVAGNQNNINLVNKNNEIHIQQYDYLLKRYLLNIERENDISMKQFREFKKHSIQWEDYKKEYGIHFKF